MMPHKPIDAMGQLLKPGTAGKKAVKHPLPDKFPTSLAALENSAPPGKPEKVEVPVAAEHKAPILRLPPDMPGKTGSSDRKATKHPQSEPSSLAQNLNQLLKKRLNDSDESASSQRIQASVAFATSSQEPSSVLPDTVSHPADGRRRNRCNAELSALPDSNLVQLDPVARFPMPSHPVTAASTAMIVPETQNKRGNGFNNKVRLDLPSVTASLLPPTQPPRLRGEQQIASSGYLPEIPHHPLLPPVTLVERATHLAPARTAIAVHGNEGIVPEPALMAKPGISRNLPHSPASHGHAASDPPPGREARVPDLQLDPQPAAFQPAAPVSQPLTVSNQTGSPISSPAAPAAAISIAASPGCEAPAVKSLTVQLQPADLGTVTVTLRLKNRELQLRLETESENTLTLLRRDETVLHQVLRAAGYEGDAASLQIVLKPAADLQQLPVRQTTGSSQHGSSSLASGNGSGQPEEQHSRAHSQHFQPEHYQHDDANLPQDDRARGIFV